MKSCTIAALATLSSAQFFNPYERIEKEKLANTRVAGQLPIRPGGLPGYTQPMTADANAVALEDTTLTQDPFYNWAPFTRGIPAQVAAAPYLIPATNQALLPPQAFIPAPQAAIPAQLLPLEQAQLLPLNQAAVLPSQTYLPTRQIIEPALWHGQIPDAQKKAKLDIVNQEGAIDQFANQANALDALYRARANAGSLNTRESLTPTAITSERQVVGPKAAADQNFRNANGGAFRNQANMVNRANKAATNSLEPIYLA